MENQFSLKKLTGWFWNEVLILTDDIKHKNKTFYKILFFNNREYEFKIIANFEALSLELH